MEQILQFLNMGGYGHFIWSSFGVSAVVLIGLLWQTLYAFRQTELILQELKNLEQKQGH